MAVLERTAGEPRDYVLVRMPAVQTALRREAGNMEQGRVSGGSYNYLYRKYPEDLLRYQGDVQQMATRLRELGHLDAASDTEQVLVTMQQYLSAVDNAQSRLAEVWRAVEWLDSCDYGPEEVAEAVTKYREQGK